MTSREYSKHVRTTSPAKQITENGNNFLKSSA